MPKSSGMEKTTTASATGGRDVNSPNTAGSIESRTSDMSQRSMPVGTAERTSNGVTANDSKTTPKSSDMDPGTPLGSARGTDTQGGNNDRYTPSDVAAVGRNSTAGSANWDKSCFISTSSSAFALQLQDGRTVKIDDAGNSRISSQLQSTDRVSKMKKVFRVKITGSLEGDTIHITDIQM